MLYVAPSILLAAAVATTTSRPVPTKRPPGDEKSAAAAWVKDGMAWTNEVTGHFEKLGKMLDPILDGKQTGDAMRAEIKKTTEVLDAKLAYFIGRPSPAFAEMNAFRAVFLDYLVWENRILVSLMSDLLKIAENRKMNRAAKEQAFVKTLRATMKDEDAWKTKIETSLRAVQAATDRN